MIDFDALVLGPAYRVFAEPALLRIGTASYAMAVIDGTRGVPIEEGGPIAVETIRPVADVRRSQLAQRGVAIPRLTDAEIAFAGQSWRIKAVIELNAIEVRLILMVDDGIIIYRATQAGDRRVTEGGEPRVLE